MTACESETESSFRLPTLAALLTNPPSEAKPRKARKISVPGEAGFIMYVALEQVDFMIKMYPNAVVD